MKYVQILVKQLKIINIKNHIINHYKNKKRSLIRSQIRSFQILKNNNNLDIVTKIKDEISNTRLIENQGNKKCNTIFASNYDKADLILRQYLIIRILDLEFNKNILRAYINRKKIINYPLPKPWRLILEKHGFIANTWPNKLHWNLFLFKQLFIGNILFIKYLYNSIKNIIYRRNYNFINYAYFHELNSNNFPVKNLDGRQSYDIFSWYKQWNDKPLIVNTYTHNALFINDDRVIDGLEYTPEPFPLLNSLKDVLKYLRWGIFASFFSFIELIKGHYMHPILLAESTKLHLVKLINPIYLAKDYLFHNSNHIYRPLWTYEAEKMGSRILFYFYSTNCETFKNKIGDTIQENIWNILTWSNYLVWDDYQSDFIIRNVGRNNRIFNVGPIWFSTKNNSLPDITQQNLIAVFDVQPYRESVYCSLGQSNGYNTFEVVYKFLFDITGVLSNKNVSILFKRKRKGGNTIHRKYINYIKKISDKPNIITIDPDIDAINVILISKAVISMPFTSTAIIAANLGKPTIFYDPTNKIDNNDRAAHGIRVISDKVELENWIFENL